MLRRQLNKLASKPKNSDADALRIAVRDEYELYVQANSDVSPADLKVCYKALKALQKSLFDNAASSSYYDAGLNGLSLGKHGETILTNALLSSANSLRALSLIKCTLDGESIGRLYPYITHPHTQLESLDLSENPLGDNGTSLALSMIAASTVSEVLMASIMLTPAGVPTVCKFLRSTRVSRSIDLSHNTLLTSSCVDDLLAAVASNVFITGFQLEGVDMTPSQTAALSASLTRNVEIAGILESLISSACRRNFKSRLAGFRQSIQANRLLTGGVGELVGPAYRWFPKMAEPPSITPCVRFQVGSVVAVGRRKEMQDVICIRGSFRERKTQDLFALFDGHGGRNAASYCADRLPTIIADNLARSDDMYVESALVNSFVQCHKEIAGWATKCGTTVVLLLVIDLRRYIAVAGDSRLVLSRAGRCAFVTTAHKTSHPSERARILAANGTIEDERVNGQLSVTRAIGDADLFPYLTAEPDVYIQDADEDDDFALMASDGIWDAVTPDAAVAFVHEQLQAYSALADAEQAKHASAADFAADALKDEAMRLGSNDNISVIIVVFGKLRAVDRQQQALQQEQEGAGAGIITPTKPLDPVFSSSAADLTRLTSFSPIEAVPVPLSARPHAPARTSVADLELMGPPPLATGPFPAKRRQRPSKEKEDGAEKEREVARPGSIITDGPVSPGADSPFSAMETAV